MSDKENKKIKLGQKTDEGYKYVAKVDFSKDIPAQIAKVIQEKEVNEILKNKVKELKKVIGRFTKKEKNLQYYYEIGKKLIFLEEKLFEGVAIGSIFRRIFEELPEIIPNIKNKDMAGRHLNFMYWVAHVKKDDVFSASWDQWFEITKFKEIYKDKKLLKQILIKCQSGVTGHETLNKVIKDLILKNKSRRIN